MNELLNQFRDRGLKEAVGLREAAEKWLEIDIVNGTKGIVPTVLVAAIDAKDGEPRLDAKAGIMVMALMTEFTEHEEKRGVMTQVGKEVYAQKKLPLAACLASEAWIVTGKLDGPGDEAKMKRTMPRDSPMRRECAVTVSSVIGDGLRGIGCMASTRLMVRRDGLLVPDPDRPDWDHLEGQSEANILQPFWLGYFDDAIQRRKK